MTKSYHLLLNLTLAHQGQVVDAVEYMAFGVFLARWEVPPQTLVRNRKVVGDLYAEF